jgi:hypothetical protein
LNTRTRNVKLTVHESLLNGPCSTDELVWKAYNLIPNQMRRDCIRRAISRLRKQNFKIEFSRPTNKYFLNPDFQRDYGNGQIK